MSIETARVRVPVWMLWVAIITLATIVVGYWYFRLDPADVKMLGLIGGILTGLVVYLATFVTLLHPLQELDRYRRMGVHGLLANRHDQVYYRLLVGRANTRVDVMGASCTRFVRDFMDSASDDKVLVEALFRERGLRVRLLIPDAAHMDQTANQHTVDTIAHVLELQRQVGDRVQVRRFADEARHSFVIADADLVAGPVFAASSSRHAPAVHVGLETAFGRKYSEYFNQVWDTAVE